MGDAGEGEGRCAALSVSGHLLEPTALPAVIDAPTFGSEALTLQTASP